MAKRSKMAKRVDMRRSLERVGLLPRTLPLPPWRTTLRQEIASGLQFRRLSKRVGMDKKTLAAIDEMIAEKRYWLKEAAKFLPKDAPWQS